MILVDRFFHADPHPGNVFYLPGNRIVIIDFGMVGRLTDTRRDEVVAMMSAIARRDAEALMEVILEWTVDAHVDETRLAYDLDELMFDYADAPLKDVRISTLLREVNALLREHSIVLPSDLTLMFKALVTLEGLGRQYDPEFRLVSHLEPFLERTLAERSQPESLVRRGRQEVNNLVNLMGTIPRDVSRLFKDARRGKLRVDLDLKRSSAGSWTTPSTGSPSAS